MHVFVIAFPCARVRMLVDVYEYASAFLHLRAEVEVHAPEHFVSAADVAVPLVVEDAGAARVDGHYVGVVHLFGSW